MPTGKASNHVKITTKGYIYNERPRDKPPETSNRYHHQHQHPPATPRANLMSDQPGNVLTGNPAADAASASKAPKRKRAATGGEIETGAEGERGPDGGERTQESEASQPGTAYRLIGNPHTQSTQRGAAPHEPSESRIAYTRAIYPRIIKSLDALTAGILESTAEAIRANPDRYIALLVYGGGNRVKEENPDLMKDIESFLKGLTIEGSERLRVVDPPKSDKASRGEFARPHILLLQDGSPKLRTFILWYQTFAFQIEGRKIAFSALRFDENVRPWFIADITGQVVDDDPNTMTEGLRAITNLLTKDTAFRNHVDACLARTEKPRPIDQRVNDVLNTFELHSMRVTNKEKKETLVWQLFANPIASNGKEYTEWLDIIKSQRYVVDTIHELVLTQSKTDRPYDSCAFCKTETHPEEQCPFPHVADWKGPIPKEVRAERAKLRDEAATRGGGRGRGNSRGGRGNGRARGSNTNAHRNRPY